MLATQFFAFCDIEFPVGEILQHRAGAICMAIKDLPWRVARFMPRSRTEIPVGPAAPWKARDRLIEQFRAVRRTL
jgi:hypothetical protein